MVSIEDIKSRLFGRMLSASLALPTESQNTVGVLVAAGRIGEKTKKGWMLLEEYLGNGYKSAKGGHVNYVHTGKILGHVRDIELNDGELQASFALSRRALDEFNIKQEDFLKHFAVSVEWLFSPSKSFADVGKQRMPLLEALSLGHVVLVKGPLGNSEIVPNPNASEEVVIYPADIEFTDIAVLDRRYCPPNFASARVLAHTNTGEFVVESVRNEVMAMAEKDGLAESIGAVFTVPNKTSFKTGVVYATMINSETSIWSYNMTDEGGVNLVMKKPIMYFPYDGDLALFLLPSVANSISPKESGHKSPPAEYAEKGAKSRSDYADPTNYNCPVMDKEHTLATLKYFSQAGNRSEYSEPEQKTVARRIVAACRRFGIQLDKDGEVAKLAGMMNLAAPDIAYCGECQRIVALTDMTEEDKDGVTVITGKCPSGHTATRAGNTFLNESAITAIMEKALNGGLLPEVEIPVANVDSGDSGDMTTYCPQCKKQMKMMGAEKTTVNGQSAMQGKCEKGHTMTRMAAKEANAAMEAVEQFKAEEMPRLIAEAVNAAKQTEEANVAVTAWINQAFESLNAIMPISEEDKPKLLEELKGIAFNSDKLEVKKVTREKEAVEAKLVEATKKSSSANIGPFFSFYPDEKSGDNQEAEDKWSFA